MVWLREGIRAVSMHASALVSFAATHLVACVDISYMQHFVGCALYIFYRSRSKVSTMINDLVVTGAHVLPEAIMALWSRCLIQISRSLEECIWNISVSLPNATAASICASSVLQLEIFRKPLAKNHVAKQLPTIRTNWAAVLPENWWLRWSFSLELLLALHRRTHFIMELVGNVPSTGPARCGTESTCIALAATVCVQSVSIAWR